MAGKYLPNPVIKIQQEEKKSRDITSDILSTFSALKQVFYTQNLSDIFLLKFVIDFSNGILTANMGYILRAEYHLGDQYISLVMIFLSICCTVTNTVLVKVNKVWKYSDTSTGKRKILFGTILLTIAFVGLFIFANFDYFVICLSLISVAKTFIDSTITEALLFRTTENNKGMAFSSLENIYLISDMICPIISSSLIEIGGYKIIYCLSSFTTIIGSVLFYSRKCQKVD